MNGKKGLFSIGFPLAMALFILGFGLPCFSESPGQGRSRGLGGPAFGGDEPPPPPEKREEIRKRIELIRMWKLTEELDLTEETGAKLFPILHKYDEKLIELRKERQNVMNQLRRALEDEATSDEAIQTAMEKVDKNALAVSDLIRQQHQELKGVLSLRQQAKFILFQREFQREMRKTISEARERRRRARRDEGKGRYDGPRGD